MKEIQESMIYCVGILFEKGVINQEQAKTLRKGAMAGDTKAYASISNFLNSIAHEDAQEATQEVAR